jgi:hypothetical protein
VAGVFLSNSGAITAVKHTKCPPAAALAVNWGECMGNFTMGNRGYLEGFRAILKFLQIIAGNIFVSGDRFAIVVHSGAISKNKLLSLSHYGIVSKNG